MADYLEGDLDLDKRALFDAHLDECANCSAEVAGMRTTISILHSLPDPPVPQEMSRQVMRRIRSGEAYSGWLEGLRAVFAPLLEPRILAPVSAGVLVLGLFLGVTDFRGQQEGTADGGMVDAGAVAGSEAILVPANGSPGFFFVQPNSGVPQVALIQPDSRREMLALSNLMANSFPLGRPQTQLTPPLAISPGYEGADMASPFEVVAMNPGGGRLQNQVPIQSDSSSIERSRQPSAEEWLVRIRQDPSGFAGRLASASLAEQELWVENLARVASQKNQLGEVVASLRSSPSRGARLLADDFEAVGREQQFR